MKLINLLLILVFSTVAQAQIRPADQQYMQSENYLLNAGFESGRTSWTESGTATDTLEQSVVRFGLQSLKIVSSSQTVNLSQIITKYAAQSSGQQGIVSAWIKSTSTIAQVCAVVDSVDTNCVTIEASNTWKEYVIPFVMGSTNNGIRVKSASDSATTYIDNAFVGVMPATMMPEISQAQIAGEAFFAGTTSCIWTRSSTTVGAYAGVAACPGPTIIRSNLGEWQTTDSNLPRVTINNLPAGEYVASFTIPAYNTVATAAAAFAINDGTTTCTSSAGNGVQNATNAVITCTFSYTSSGNRSFELYAASTGTSVNIYNESTAPSVPTKFLLTYFPPKSKVYSGQTIYPHAQLYGTLSYIGATNCIWSITNAAFTNFAADADCNAPTATGRISAPSTKIPAFILPAGSPQGTYQIVTRAGFGGGASGGRNHYYRYSDGTRVSTSGLIYQSNSIPVQSEMSGQITYDGAITTDQTIQIQGGSSSGETTVNANSSTNLWGLTFEVYYFPPRDNPLIGTFAGIEKCANDFECTDVFSAKVSSAGVVSDENLDFINGSCSVSGGSRTCTFNSSIFTVAPNCVAIASTGVGVTDFDRATAVGTSSTQVSILTENTGDLAGSAQNVQLICQKQGSDYKPKTAKAATTNEMMYVPNVTRPKTCYYAFGGASATLSAPTSCAASPCIEIYDSCSAGTAPTRSASGVYDDLTFANGTWKNSTFLDCKYQSFSTTAGSDSLAIPIFRTGDNTWATNSNGGAVLNLRTLTVFTSPSDAYVQITCTADAP